MRVINSLIIFFLLQLYVNIAVAADFDGNSISGKVSDERQRGVSYIYVTVIAPDGQQHNTLTNDQGYYRISNLLNGEYRVATQPFLYHPVEKRISLNKDLVVNIHLESVTHNLEEVIVSAAESEGITSSSRIDSMAMRHLQPTSFTDILELLPGGKSTDPNMGSANLIKLRDASSSDMSSLGVSFIIDGANISNDANLQSISGTTYGSRVETVSKGIDMRTISTDNISSVEIIRGIPSAEYGDLTSGLVLIERKRNASPYTARFKADQYSKLFSVGKGYSIGALGDVLNLDFSYLDSKIDPRNKFENYTRFTTSLRWNAKRSLDYGVIDWRVSSDYTGSFDDYKTDLDISSLTNSYKSDYNKGSLATLWHLKLDKGYWVENVKATLSASLESNQINQLKDVTLNKPTAIPVTDVEGESNGIFLPYTYLADVSMDGKPTYINAAISADSRFLIAGAENLLKYGVGWDYSKNFGHGESYDLTRPLGLNNVSRPRDFSQIPSVQKLSAYLSDDISINVGEHNLFATFGVRATMMTNLSSQYALHGDLMLDPRVNVRWNLPIIKGWNLNLTAGLGYLSKMPTTAQLYPNDIYNDITQLNYYHPNPDFRIINYQTYKWENVNYELTAARNRKYEFRLGASKGGNSFSITYYDENMENAFSNGSYYKSLAYKHYDEQSIDDTQLTSPPDLNNVSYERDYRINTFTQVGNNATIDKHGIEFQLTTKRFEKIKTRFTINGAWFYTKHSNKSTQYKEQNILLDNNQLEYIGIYDWEDGTEYNQFTTNTLIDTYIPKIDLILSLSLQCSWIKNSTNLWNDGVPTEYVDKWGDVHKYTDEDLKDMVLQHLAITYSSIYFDTRTTPFSMDANLKITKKVGRYLNLSMFVNRLFGIYPDYYEGGMLIRRNASAPYFGMELNINI